MAVPGIKSTRTVSFPEASYDDCLLYTSDAADE